MTDIAVAESVQKKIGKNKLRQLHRKLAKEPNSYKANLQMGIFYFQKNKAAKAITYLEKACDAKKDHAELLFILANAYKIMNNVPRSEDCFKKALDLEPENFEYLYNYGLLLHSSYRLDEAINIFVKAVRLQPDSHELLNYIGVLYHLQKKYKEAVNFFNESIKINPDYILSAINIGQAYLATNDFINAQRIIDQISITHSQNPEVVELKKQLDTALDKIGDGIVDLHTELSFSDRLFQISPDMKRSSFKFGTKAQTLENLDGCLSKAELLPQLSFTEEEWNNNKGKIVINIIKKFENRKLAIRSSALCEDSFFSSMAGNFHSELNVECDEMQITASVNRVISSYSISPDPDNEILVMPMVDNVSMSGVIFTHDLETGAPYYVIHYDDRSGKTDIITSGKRGNLKMFTYCKLFSRLPSDQDMARLIEMVKELEEVVQVDGLDIEFASSGKTLYLLQIRPIAVKKNKDDFDKEEFKEYLLEIKSFIMKNNQPFPNLHGKGTAYGIMPDWNPAEIIGVDPKPLAFSMYKELITDQIWPQSRRELGYKDVSYQPGICSLAGKPYVDIRMSFNTFLPRGLSKSLADKLVDYYILKLRTHQDFHDKVEFKIAYTCYRLDSDHMKEELSKEGFSNNEIEELKEALFFLTENIVSERVTTIENELQYTKLLEEHRTLLGYSDIPPLAKVAQLVHECKRYGTLPFSKLARFAFIGTSLFKSLLELGLISQEQYQCFFEGIPTVATDFINDLNLLKKEDIKRSDFLQKYGHLRPGTYDICSKSYAEAFEEYCDMENLPESRRSDCSYSLDTKTMNRISIELKKQGLPFNADVLLDFTRRAVQARERAKYEFTKNIDTIFKYIIEYFKEYKLSREDISHIDLKNILLLSHDAIGPDTMERLISEIQLNKKKYKITKAIKLPPLIFLDRSVNYFTSIDALPNFVTKETVVGKIVYLSTVNASKVNLSGKIVLIENADPGYDWIFSHKIMGLVTAFGGAASHMAIRCAEFKLPAAIGCGATLFDYLKSFTKIELNCGSKQIREIL